MIPDLSRAHSAGDARPHHRLEDGMKAPTPRLPYGDRWLGPAWLSSGDEARPRGDWQTLAESGRAQDPLVGVPRARRYVSCPSRAT